MRHLRLVLALLPALALVACGDGGAGNVVASAELGQEYVIGFGETIHVASLSLEFTTLDSDSRCPESVKCVWEGNARILLTATHGGATSVFELNTSSRFPTRAVFEGYTIELRHLDPYPALPSTPIPEGYTATVFVD